MTPGRQLLLLMMLLCAIAHPPDAWAGARAEGKDAPAACAPAAKFYKIPAVKPERQALIREIYDQIKSYGDCDESLACCLARTPPSRFADRLARAVVRMVLKGHSAAEVAEEMQRRRQAFAGPVKTIDLTGRPCLGSPDALVKVVEYSEFECPFCRQTARALARVVPKFGDRAALCYKFFPLVRSHPLSLGAARLGVHAHRAGKFWEVYDKLTESPPVLEPEALALTAEEVGLQGTGLDDASTLDLIDADLREGHRIGVSGVPAVYINGREYDGFRDPSSLFERIEEELDRLAGQAAPAAKGTP